MNNTKLSSTSVLQQANVAFDAELYQAAARVLHHVFYAYPTAQSVNEFAKNKLAQNWPFDSKACELLAKTLKEWDSSDDVGRTQQLLALKLDYGQLFFGPGDPKAAPWGSVYTSEAQLLNERTTQQLLAFYRRHGVVVQTQLNEPHDHIGLIFSVMENLLKVMASQHGQVQAQEKLETLLAEHLLPWSSRCLELASEHAKTPYYQGFAILAQEYLDKLCHELAIEERVINLRLYR